jgi:hypothetical protein
VTIIDYASPRPRSKLRLPSRSRIVCQYEPGRLTVVEELKADGGAIAGVVFAALLLGYFGTFSFLADGWRGFLVDLIFMAPYAGLILLVIDRTWRKTVLSVTARELRLMSGSSIHRKNYRWDATNVLDVANWGTANPPNDTPLSEVRIQISDGEDIRLFTDHRSSEIDELAIAIRGALAGEA